MIRVLTLVVSIFFAQQSFSSTIASESYVPVSKTLNLYVRYQPAAAGHPTLVILSGLTHSTENWNKFLQHFTPTGAGLVQIDLAGQGKTLSRNGAVYDVIRYQDQAAYVKQVLQHLKVKTKISLLGLSYGGGIATYFATKYPQQVARLIILAPYTEPQPEQDKWIRDQIKATRIAFPYNPATDDELYDYFLRQLVYNTYPLAEPDLLTTPFKLEAVYRMAQGIRKLHTANQAKALPANSVYLVGGSSDRVVSPDTLNRFWSKIPSSSKASRLVIRGAEHDLIKLQPKLVANWVMLIMANDPQTLGDKVIEVDQL